VLYQKTALYVRGSAVIRWTCIFYGIGVVAGPAPWMLHSILVPDVSRDWWNGKASALIFLAAMLVTLVVVYRVVGGNAPRWPKDESRTSPATAAGAASATSAAAGR